MKVFMQMLLLTLFGLFGLTCHAEDELELDTTFIKGNKELPQMMYIVPWQDMKSAKGKSSNQNLTLHSLFGDIFDPLLPDETGDLTGNNR